MRSSKWLEHVSRAYAQAGKRVSPTLRRDLITPGADSGDDARFKQAFELFIRYFFKMGTQGAAFGDVRKIKRMFESSLEENYGLSSGPFINLARTYWTFKIELDDLIVENSEFPLTEILRSVEHNVASVFFPTPGPVRIPVSARAAMQRQMLEAYAPEVDIKTFLSENPILRADTRSQRSGCLSFLAFFSASFSILAALVVGLVLSLYAARRSRETLFIPNLRDRDGKG